MTKLETNFEAKYKASKNENEGKFADLNEKITKLTLALDHSKLDLLDLKSLKAHKVDLIGIHE